MSAIDLLNKAIDFDATGHKLQAAQLYRDGIIELQNMWRIQSDPVIKYKLEKLIIEHEERAKVLNNDIERWTSKGEIKDQIIILDGSRRHSYETLFNKYLDSTISDVTIEEPYLKNNNQLNNLVSFCELLVSKCANLKIIRIKTTSIKQNNMKHTFNMPLNHQKRQSAFESLSKSLRDFGIEITYEMDDKFHHRQVILSNGYVIKICRGLHFFKSPPDSYCIGTFNYTLRECLQTNIDVLFCPAIKKI